MGTRRGLGCGGERGVYADGVAGVDGLKLREAAGGPYSFTTSRLPVLLPSFTVHPGESDNFQPSPEKVDSSSLVGAATQR